MRKILTPELLLILAITAAAVALRIIWMLKVPNTPVYDFATYHEIAVNIANGKGHTYQGEAIAFQGMGYPALLGLFYKLTGTTSVLAGKALNVLLSTATLFLVYAIFRKLTENWKLRLAAYALVAFLPNYIGYVNVIGAEVLLAFLFAAVILLQVCRFNKWVRWPLLGFFTGLAALTKPVFLAYPLIAAAVHYLRAKHLKESAVQLFVVTLVMAVTVAPWTYRNYQKFGAFIPVSYNSGYVFYLNNNANNVTGGWMPLKDAAATPELRAKIDEVLQHGKRSEKLAFELDPLLKAEGQRFLLSHPFEFLKLGILRVEQTFFSGAWDVQSWAMNELYPEQPFWTKELERNLKAFRAVADTLIYLMSSLSFVFVFYGVVRAARSLFRREETLSDALLIPTLNIAFFVAVYFVFEGQARYNFPLLFLLAFCAVVCADWIRRGVQSMGR
jgi:4-amino-4-deoxy-L-arabinose transferase-like glycosyltransferase